MDNTNWNIINIFCFVFIYVCFLLLFFCCWGSREVHFAWMIRCYSDSTSWYNFGIPLTHSVCTFEKQSCAKWANTHAHNHHTSNWGVSCSHPMFDPYPILQRSVREHLVIMPFHLGRRWWAHAASCQETLDHFRCAQNTHTHSHAFRAPWVVADGLCGVRVHRWPLHYHTRSFACELWTSQTYRSMCESRVSSSWPMASSPIRTIHHMVMDDSAVKSVQLLIR